MKLEEKIENIKKLASIGYSHEQIAEALTDNAPARQIMVLELSNPDTPCYMAYKEGLLFGELNIDTKLQEQANRGHSDSVKLIEIRAKRRKTDRIKSELFGV